MTHRTAPKLILPFAYPSCKLSTYPAVFHNGTQPKTEFEEVAFAPAGSMFERIDRQFLEEYTRMAEGGVG